VQYDPPDEPNVLFNSSIYQSTPLFNCFLEVLYVDVLCHIFLYCYQEYIHRVGRIARGEGGKGNALLFLIPEELQFLRYLKVSFSHLTMDY